MPGRSSRRSYSSSRSSSSSSSRNSSRPSYSYSSPKSPAPISSPAPTPAPTPTTPTVNPNQQVQQPGFVSNVVQGFGLGAGQSIAMNIFRSDPKVAHVHENAPASTTTASSVTPSNLESVYDKEFKQCMKDKWDDKETCNQYVQCLKDNKDDKNLCKQFM